MMGDFISREAALKFRLTASLRPEKLTVAQAVADAIAEYIQAIPAADVVERPCWTPVTERLPGDDQRVLAYYGFDRGDGYLGMMFMQVLDYFARDPRPHFQHEGTNGMKVTHWMPLPEPPKEEA